MIQSPSPLGIHVSATPIASIGTRSLEEYWARRRTRETCWTLRSQVSSSPRFGCIILPTLILLLLQWLGEQSFLNDPTSLDLDLYQGLIFLKHYPGNPEDLLLNFTVADKVRPRTESAISALNICSEFGIAQTVDLKPDRSNIPVTRDNKLQYILCVSHYRLTKQIKQQSDAFFEGLSDMIDPKWLRWMPMHLLRFHLSILTRPLPPVGCLINKNHKPYWRREYPNRHG